MRRILLLLLLCIWSESNSQNFSKRDSLQGGLPMERTSYDVLFYDLDLYVDVDKKQIQGSNTITFKAVHPTKKIQVDLFENLTIEEIYLYQTDQIKSKLKYKREYDAVFIDLGFALVVGDEYQLKISYKGFPKEAKNAPWDGGFVWQTDASNKAFVGVAVQGTGASLWYPCKDSQSDEPDRGARISIRVADGLVAVSNGRLKESFKPDLYTRKWIWEVTNPINNYCITLNIGDYVHFNEQLEGLDVDYYVLRENEQKAKAHFTHDMQPMLRCFQQKFGEYPFKEDGFKIVETPYLGMEHQSAVAYGNKYLKGYLGRDMTGTGVGKLFDYILIHETAHEWFGNSVTSKDIADLWIHEGFTTYAEAVFVECTQSYDHALLYLKGQSRLVENKRPVIGQFGVNYKSTNSDAYYKGAQLLNTLRHSLNNDALWWQSLLGFCNKYKKQIIEGKEVIAYFSEVFGRDLTPVFNQYLKETSLPTLEITRTDQGFTYRWIAPEEDFDLPITVLVDGNPVSIEPTSALKTYVLKDSLKKVSVDKRKFYIETQYLGFL